MYINGMIIKQANNLYYIFSEYGELKAQVYLPQDQQLLADATTLASITRALGIRWGIIKPTKKTK